MTEPPPSTRRPSPGARVSPVEVEPAPAPADSRPLPPVLLALAMLLFGLAGVMAGVLCVLLIPFRVGATLVPIAPVLALVFGLGLPAIARGLTDTARSAAPPAIGQILAVVLLGVLPRPEGDVLMPAGSTTAISYAVLGLGLLAPMFTLGIAAQPGPWTWTTVRHGALRPGSPRPPAGSGSDTGDVR